MQKNKIKFLSTAFDLKSLNFINSLNPEFIKIPSGEITNFQLIKEITQLKKKVILSTGMSNLNEISKTYKFLTKNGVVEKKIYVLQCNTEYPTPFTDVNLNVLKTFKKNLETILVIQIIQWVSKLQLHLYPLVQKL